MANNSLNLSLENGNRITEIKSAIGSGARNNKWIVIFSFPSVVATQFTEVNSVDGKKFEDTAQLLCKSSTIPERTIGTIEVWNQGRKYLIPGDSSYSNTWQCTFYCTVDHYLRRAFLAWMKACDHAQTGSHTGIPSDVQVTMTIAQLDATDTAATAYYTLHNVFPTEVGALSMDQASEGQILDLEVTFSYSDWVTGKEDDSDTTTALNSFAPQSTALNGDGASSW